MNKLDIVTIITELVGLLKGDSHLREEEKESLLYELEDLRFTYRALEAEHYAKDEYKRLTGEDF